MGDSALLKLQRAGRHIAELSALVSKTRPFPLVLKTDIQTGQRTLGCKKNEAVADIIALLCGDAIHNLRSALDHAYWEIVSPHCSAGELRDVQFPFSSKAERLDKAIQRRKGHCAGTGFYCAVRNLKPYGDLGGNLLLFLIHEMDVTDKHKLLLPAVDESTHTFEWLETIDPDIPWKGWRGSSVTLSDQADVSWTNKTVTPDQLGVRVGEHLFERVLDVEVSVVFPITLHENIIVKLPPAVPMLHGMLDIALKTIHTIRASASSS
jgi:hypothetical protein